MPDGRSPGAGAEARANPGAEAMLAAALARGIAHFDAGRFFDAHEDWEEAWHACAPDERDFYQGLVHAAAACLHHQRGNAHGFGKQCEKLRRRLGPFGPKRHGVDVGKLMAAIENLPAPGIAATYPRLS